MCLVSPSCSLLLQIDHRLLADPTVPAIIAPFVVTLRPSSQPQSLSTGLLIRTRHICSRRTLKLTWQPPSSLAISSRAPPTLGRAYASTPSPRDLLTLSYATRSSCLSFRCERSSHRLPFLRGTSWTDVLHCVRLPRFQSSFARPSHIPSNTRTRLSRSLGLPRCSFMIVGGGRAAMMSPPLFHDSLHFLSSLVSRLTMIPSSVSVRFHPKRHRSIFSRLAPSPK